MTSTHRSRPSNYSSGSIVDRLALSRAQHLQSRENRVKSISDDDIDAVSDWSDSDRECCPLSDFESNPYEDDFLDEKKLPSITPADHSPRTKTLVSFPNDSTTSTRTSFTNENERVPEESKKKWSAHSIKSRQTPLLPARRQASSDLPPPRAGNSSQLSYAPRYRQPISPTPTRLPQRRETPSTSASSHTHLPKESSNLFVHSQEDSSSQRQVISPNLSQGSVPRVYEVKKSFVDESDYGRLTEASSTRAIQARNRQKWGTIVHPPFPLGYQQVSPEQITQAVERLSSPVRCRDRHTPMQAAAKRYLSVEETDALISRLTKVKTVRAPEQFWPVQRATRAMKPLGHSNTFKTIGISA